MIEETPNTKKRASSGKRKGFKGKRRQRTGIALNWKWRFLVLRPRPLWISLRVSLLAPFLPLAGGSRIHVRRDTASSIWLHAASHEAMTETDRPLKKFICSVAYPSLPTDFGERTNVAIYDLSFSYLLSVDVRRSRPSTLFCCSLVPKRTLWLSSPLSRTLHTFHSRTNLPLFSVEPL